MLWLIAVLLLICGSIPIVVQAYDVVTWKGKFYYKKEGWLYNTESYMYIESATDGAEFTKISNVPQSKGWSRQDKSGKSNFKVDEAKLAAAYSQVEKDVYNEEWNESNMGKHLPKWTVDAKINLKYKTSDGQILWQYQYQDAATPLKHNNKYVAKFTPDNYYWAYTMTDARGLTLWGQRWANYSHWEGYGFYFSVDEVLNDMKTDCYRYFFTHSYTSSTVAHWKSLQNTGYIDDLGFHAYYNLGADDAEWSADFDEKSDGLEDPTVIKKGKSYTVNSTAPTREGYTFKGWKLKSDGKLYGGKDGAKKVTNVTENLVFTAEWKKVESHKVTVVDVYVTEDGEELAQKQREKKSVNHEEIYKVKPLATASREYKADEEIEAGIIEKVKFDRAEIDKEMEGSEVDGENVKVCVLEDCTVTFYYTVKVKSDKVTLKVVDKYVSSSGEELKKTERSKEKYDEGTSVEVEALSAEDYEIKVGDKIDGDKVTKVEFKNAKVNPTDAGLKVNNKVVSGEIKSDATVTYTYTVTLSEGAKVTVKHVNGDTGTEYTSHRKVEEVDPGTSKTYKSIAAVKTDIENQVKSANTGQEGEASVAVVINVDKNGDGAWKIEEETVSGKVTQTVVIIFEYYGVWTPEGLEIPDPPKEFKWISSTGTQLSEIKHKAPNNEEYEAMAGVPTTEDLYWGVGATEFIAQIKGQITSTSGERLYTYNYRRMNCIGADAPCVYSCPGHSFSIPSHQYATCQGEMNAHDCTDACTTTEIVNDCSDACENCGNCTKEVEVDCCTGELNRHDHHSGCNDCSGASITIYCNSSDQSGEITCTCNAQSPTVLPWSVPAAPWGSHAQHCTGPNGDKYTGVGCVHTQPSCPGGQGTCNSVHPHTHTFTGKVNQEIGLFYYADMESLHVWQLSGAELNGNEELFSNPDQSISFGNGWSYFDAGSDIIGTGRVLFHNSTPASEGSGFIMGNGDYTYNKTQSGDLILFTDADVEATDWLNGAVNSVQTYAQVVSDYAVLETSSGYQSLLFHTYYSGTSYNAREKIQLTDEQFSTGSSNKGTLEGNKIKFDGQGVNTYYSRIWSGNANAAGTKPTDGWLAYAGYNGNYSSPYNKYSCSGGGNNPAGGYVATEERSGGGGGAMAMVVTGLNIIDSTFEFNGDPKYWDASDGVEPIVNGVYETGEAKVQYGKGISIGEVPGPNFGNTLELSAGYTPATNELNKIKVYNPVSSEAAKVISNPSEYDMRTPASKVAGADSVEPTTTIAYKLKCSETGQLHDASCYVTVNVSAQCTGITNTHVHTTACYRTDDQGTADPVDDVQVLDCPDSTKLNGHAHTAACTATTKQVLVCTDPHHHEAGEPFDISLPKHHHAYGDTRCWEVDVTYGADTAAPSSGTFINLDTEFQIYFPDEMTFHEADEEIFGIAEVSNKLGLGWYTGKDISEWSRSKVVIFPFSVEDVNGTVWTAGKRINLNDLPNEGGYYTFRCLLANAEVSNSVVQFNNIAINAPEEILIEENMGMTNEPINAEGYLNYSNGYKTQEVDVLGYIGNLTLVDTGDFRYANLFKEEATSGWLVDNVIPAVDSSKQKTILSDRVTILRKDISSALEDLGVGTYGLTGKNDVSMRYFPLVPSLNNVLEVKDEEMLPGYMLFMDVETIGNYYGTNIDPVTGEFLDVNGTQRMVVTPKYYALDKDSGALTPIDVYSMINGVAVPVALFNSPETSSSHLLTMKWADSESRRFLTDNELASNKALDASTTDLRFPWSKVSDELGTAARIYLYDVNRTFVGSSLTDGVNHNLGSKIPEMDFLKQSQRWFFDVGLPSSSVFVQSGLTCSQANVDMLKSKDPYILCALNIRVQGEVWALEYDGTAINQALVDGFVIDSSGKEYKLTTLTGQMLKDPIVAVFDSQKTSRSDLTTGGTH